MTSFTNSQLHCSSSDVPRKSLQHSVMKGGTIDVKLFDNKLNLQTLRWPNIKTNGLAARLLLRLRWHYRKGLSLRNQRCLG
jgi:hypothetical protein